MKIVLLKSSAREIGPTGQVVQPGETVDVPKPLAEALLRQTDAWGTPTTKAPTKPDSTEEDS